MAHFCPFCLSDFLCFFLYLFVCFGVQNIFYLVFMRGFGQIDNNLSQSFVKMQCKKISLVKIQLPQKLLQLIATIFVETKIFYFICCTNVFFNSKPLEISSRKKDLCFYCDLIMKCGECTAAIAVLPMCHQISEVKSIRYLLCCVLHSDWSLYSFFQSNNRFRTHTS